MTTRLIPTIFSDSSSDNTDSIFDLFRQIQESRHAQAAGTPTAPASKEDKTTATAEVKQPQEARIFSFPSMHTLLRLSHVVNDFTPVTIPFTETVKTTLIC